MTEPIVLGVPDPKLPDVHRTPEEELADALLPDRRPAQSQDDESDSYAAYRNTLRETEDDETIQRVLGREDPNTPVDFRQLALDAEAAQDEQARLDFERGTGRDVEDPQGIATNIFPVVKDIARGAIESPVQIVAGAFEATEEALNKLLIPMRSFSEWYQDFFGTDPVPITDPETGEEIGLAPLDQAGDFAPPKSVTGNVIRSGSKFLAAFIPVFRAMRGTALLGGAGAVSKLAAGSLAGGLADAITLAPDESILDGFIAENPALRGPWAQFLAGGPDDSEAMGVLRNAVFGLGLGASAEGVFRGLMFMRSSMIARRALRAETEGVRPPAAAAEGVTPEQVRLSPEDLGDDLVRAEPLEESISREVDDELVKLAESGQVDPRAPELIKQERIQARLAAATARITALFPSGNLSRAEITRLARLEATKVKVNLDKLNTVDDVKRLIQETTDLFPGPVKRARRGEQSDEATLAAANISGISTADLLARSVGAAPTPIEVIAYRKVHAAAAEGVDALARIADGLTTGTALAQYNFRRGFATFEVINEAFLGARAESGRSLRAWGIPLETSGELRAKLLAELIEQSGGEKVSKKLAKKFIQAVDEAWEPGQISVLVRKGAGARTLDAVSESFVLGLLWSPQTHIVNTASPYIVAFQQIAETAVASRIARVAGRTGPDDVAPGEAMARIWGLTRGVEAMWSRAKLGALQGQGIRGRVRAAREGIQGLREELGIPATSKLDDTSAKITSNLLGPRPTTGLGRAIDFIGRKLHIGSATGRINQGIDAFGRLTRVPGAALGFEDDMGKIVGYSTEIHAQAFRRAFAEGPDNVAERMVELVMDPTDDLRLAGITNATYTTFQNPGGFVISFLNAGRKIPGAFIILPFVKTPLNIMSYTFERTPIAPVMGRYREAIKAGGARADLARAKMALGSTATLFFLDAADRGDITGSGPKDPAQRANMIETGWQPDSMFVNGKYFRINRIDSLGFQASIAGNIGEAMRRGDFTEEDLTDLSALVAMMAAAAGDASMSKTYLYGMATIADVLRFEGAGERFIDRTTGNLVPFSSALRIAQGGIDPELREPIGIWENVESRVKLWSDQIPSRRNLAGETISPQEVYGRTFNLLSPVRVTEGGQGRPMFQEMVDQEIGIRRIRRKGSSFSAGVKTAVSINFRAWDDVYQEYQKLAGNELKMPGDKRNWPNGLGMADAMDALVTGKAGRASEQYAAAGGGPEGPKKKILQDIVTGYRKAAQVAIMQDPRFAKFQAHVERLRVREIEKQRGTPE